MNNISTELITVLTHLELSEEVLQSKGIFFLRKPFYKMAQDNINFPHQNTKWESQIIIYFVKKTCLFLKTVFSITLQPIIF